MLVNSLKLIWNPDGPGASAPDLSPVHCIYSVYTVCCQLYIQCIYSFHTLSMHYRFHRRIYEHCICTVYTLHIQCIYSEYKKKQKKHLHCIYTVLHYLFEHLERLCNILEHLDITGEWQIKSSVSVVASKNIVNDLFSADTGLSPVKPKEPIV